MFLKALLKITINASALYVAHLWVDGVTLFFDEQNTLSTVGIIFLVGFALWIAQTIVKPVIKLLTFPLIMLTFGLFAAVINLFVIWGAAELLPQLEIIGLVPLIWTALILTVFNSIFFFV